MISTMTTQQRVEGAMDALRAQDLKAVLNTTACCRSCACAEATGAGVLAFEYAAKWRGGQLVYGAASEWAGEYVTSLAFNFPMDRLDVAEACRKAFLEQGFPVEWDETERRCVEVFLN